jgi:hypothetical protein
MIPVPHPIPEPDDFDEKCRQAGKEWLKEAGLKQTLAPDVLAAKEEIEAARAAKRDHLSALRQRRRTGRAPVITPAGTPAQRLEVLRKTAIRKVFTSTFRQPAHGETKVVLTDDPAKVGVTQTPYDDWNVYAKSYRHGPAKCLDTVVTVRLRWRTRVERRGLAVLNGMMTLDAILVGSRPTMCGCYTQHGPHKGGGTRLTSSTALLQSATESAITPILRKVRCQG